MLHYMKKITRIKTKTYTFSFNETIIELLDRLNNNLGFDNRSETLRYCVRRTHKSEFPHYKKVWEENKEKQAVHAEQLALPDEKYALEVLQGDIEVRKGWCRIVHRQKPANKADVRLDKVKNYASRNEVWADSGITGETE